ncbi:MAG: helix-hairpin-helix domain-containing protein [Synergistaceae bacterium]|nr:helix-hairpin-helix domain-containing protein [Synergistaceae bacterium]
MKELLTELWTKYRKGSLFAFGMACFLAAGLLVWALPEKSKEPPAARTEQTEEIAARFHSPARKDVPDSASDSSSKTGKTQSGGESGAGEGEESEAGKERAEQERPDDRWFLYVTGSVRNPGVYRLPPGARLVHLVEAAGGLSGLADPAAVNLAAFLEDGMHVHVPKKGDRTQEQAWAVIPHVPLASPASSSGVSSSGASGALIDVNRATEEELVGLKGIGPVLAKSIVEDRRKNGPFRNVEDLVRVRGIGLKKLEGFRDRVVARP